MATSERRPIDGRDAAMIRAGRELGHASSMFGHAMAERLGIAPADWECLSLLFEHGPMPAGRLAELTGLSTGAITGLVDRLAAAGFVTRRRDRDDRRRVFVELVDESVGTVQPVCDPMLAELVELHARYSDDEVALVVRALQEGAEVVLRHALLIRSGSSRSGSSRSGSSRSGSSRSGSPPSGAEDEPAVRDAGAASG